MSWRSRVTPAVDLCGTVIAAAWLTAVTALAQPPGVRSEAVSVSSDPAGTRQLLTALERIAAEDWETALPLLAEFETRFADVLVDVAPDRMLTGRMASQVVRQQLPAAARSRQRVQLDPLAEDWWNTGQRRQSEAELERILTRAAASRYGGTAAALLAEWSWERGDLDRACAFWSLLVSDTAQSATAAKEISAAEPLRFSSEKLTEADLAARRLLAERFDGDTVRARQLWRSFAAAFPEVEGRLAGRSGRLVDLLRTELQAELDGPGEAPSGPSGSMTAGARPRRIAQNQSLTCELLVGLPQWRSPLAAQGWGPRISSRPLLRRDAGPVVVPAVQGESLFVQDARDLRALRPSDGLPLWPTSLPDDRGQFAPSDLPLDRGARSLGLPLLGEARLAPAVWAGRLFAVVGPPIAFASAQEPQAILTRLEAFDIQAQEGKLLWARAAHEVCPDAAWRYSGPPLAHQGNVLIAVRHAGPDVAIGIVCLDARTGERRWFQRICGLLIVPPPILHVVTADQLAIGFDRVYLAGDFGATACLALADGALQWVIRDAAAPWRVPTVTPRAETSGRAAVYHRGRVHSVQHDDRTLQQLDVVTGTPYWRRTLSSEISQLVAVHGGVVVAAGKHLWGVDFETGEVRWKFGFTDPAGAIYGRPLVAGSVVWACTREELFALDLETGALQRRIPLRAAWGVTGGTLLAEGERLFICGDDELVALDAHRVARSEWRP